MAFSDRASAGERLGREVAKVVDGDDTVVLGLVMGGVPVAAAVSDALGAPLEVFVVRKLVEPKDGVAVGAVASGGIQVFDDAAIERFGVQESAVAAVLAHELKELRRSETLLREHRLEGALKGKRVVLVDDALSTGVTMAAAIAAVRRLGAREVVVAVPVGASAALAVLEKLADRIVCLDRRGGGAFDLRAIYRAPQPSEHDVLELLGARSAVG